MSSATVLQSQLDALFARRRGQKVRSLDGVKTALKALPFPTHPWCQGALDTKEATATAPQLVQVVGTNGKGSSATMLAQMCQAAGLHTGLFTSPHLHHFRERFQVDGVHPSDTTLSRWLGRLEALPETHGLAFFDVATLLALCLFVEAKVDVGIFEAGIGGRLDATSALPATLTILTNVGLDHQQWLGPDRESIAADKAAAIRSRGISGVTQPALQAQITTQARAQGVTELWQWPEDFSYRDEPQAGLDISLHPRTKSLQRQPVPRDDWDGSADTMCVFGAKLSLGGHFQHHNAALAVAGFGMLCSLRRTSAPATAGSPGIAQPGKPGRDAWRAAVHEGLASATWPGRLQTLRCGPTTVLLDGAHNPDAAEALGQNLPHGPFHLVFGAADDKDIAGCLAPLLHRCAAIHFCPFDQPRAADEARLHHALAACTAAPQPPAKMHPTVAAALEAALQHTEDQPEAFVLVTGSLFVVAEALAALKRKPTPPTKTGFSRAHH